MSIGNVRPDLDFGFLFVYRIDGIRFRRTPVRLNSTFINLNLAPALLIEGEVAIRYLAKNEIARRQNLLMKFGVLCCQA